MRYYLPTEDKVISGALTSDSWAVPLYEERTWTETNRSLIPGTLVQTSWDSVSLGLLKSCPRKYWFTVLLGWNQNPVPSPLQFGINFHTCMETYQRLLAKKFTKDEAQLRTVRLALLLGEYLLPGRTERTKQTLARAVSWYLDQYRDDACEVTMVSPGVPTVEYSFCIPLADEEGLFQINGEQVWLAGHLDNYSKFMGDYYVRDYKTTKGQLDSGFFDEFKISYQQKGYFASAHALAAIPTSAIPTAPKGVIVDGIQLGVNYNRFARTIVTWTDLQMTDYLTDLKVLIQSATLFAEKGRWPANEQSCVGRWGKCQFFDVCAATPPKRQKMLESNFKKSTWDCRKTR
jgi:hypothetical protein